MVRDVAAVLLEPGNEVDRRLSCRAVVVSLIRVARALSGSSQHDVKGGVDALQADFVEELPGGLLSDVVS